MNRPTRFVFKDRIYIDRTPDEADILQKNLMVSDGLRRYPRMSKEWLPRIYYFAPVIHLA